MPISHGVVFDHQKIDKKEPLKHAAGDNSSLTFTVCVKSVPLYHSKLA